MFREGPSCQEFSQHAQSWAVLNGMLSGEEARRVMRRTFEEKDVLRCYFSTCYELFRACEKAGCYELTARQMDWWIKLLEEHCTTCPETPSNSRSECHAWSALPMYELISVMGGIRREAGSPARVEVCPHLDYVPNLEGGMLTRNMGWLPSAIIQRMAACSMSWQLAGGNGRKLPGSKRRQRCAEGR